MQWTQIYDPLGHWWLSTLVAALPIIVLFGMLAGFKVKPHSCAIAGASTAVAVAILFFKMPPALAAITFGYGVAFGVLKIAWIVLAAVYLYDISVETGQFEIMKESVAWIRCLLPRWLSRSRLGGSAAGARQPLAQFPRRPFLASPP